MTAAFRESRLPDAIASGAKGGPDLTGGIDKPQAGSGFLFANLRWDSPLWRFDLSLATKSEAKAELMWNFLLGVAMISAYGFRIKHWGDYKANGQPLAGVVDGVNTVFQLQKVYSYDGYSFARPLMKIARVSDGAPLPVIYRSAVAVSAGDYTINYNTGAVTFAAAPVSGTYTSDCEFDVPVKLTGDWAPSTVLLPLRQRFEGLQLLEMRNST
jgi:uncharacterized protein (TIGR02217 family)